MHQSRLQVKRSPKVDWQLEIEIETSWGCYQAGFNNISVLTSHVGDDAFQYTPNIPETRALAPAAIAAVSLLPRRSFQRRRPRFDPNERRRIHS